MQSTALALADQPPRQFRTRSAFLIPAEGAALVGVQQTRIAVLGEARVFQDPLEASVSSQEDPRHFRSKSRSIVALEPMSAREALGVPYSAQLRVVNHHGEDLETCALWLHESRYEPEVFSLIQHGVPGESQAPIPIEAYVSGSVWTVAFAFDPPVT